MLQFKQNFSGVNVCRYHRNYLYKALALPAGDTAVRLTVSEPCQGYLQALQTEQDSPAGRVMLARIESNCLTYLQGDYQKAPALTLHIALE